MIPSSESREHPFDRAVRYVGLFMCAAVTVFTIYTILRGQFSAQMQRGVFLLGAGTALLCLKPFNRGWAESGKPMLEWINRSVNLIFIGLLTFSVVYLFLFYFEIARSRQSLPNTWDLICYGTGTLAVLEGAKMPAVLIEVGYLTNPSDEKNLNDSKYLDRLSQAIAKGIESYLASLRQPSK